jgi:hypothetical protein
LVLGGGLAITAFAAKLLYETTTGATLFVNSPAAGFVPLPLVHLVGGCVGLVVGLAEKIADQLPREKCITSARLSKQNFSIRGFLRSGNV